MNQQEKLRLAHQLDRLGVDVIEAGFPIASDGDFESVKAIAAVVRRPIIAGAGAGMPAGHRAGVGSVEGCGASAHSCVPGDFRYSSAIQAAHDARSVREAGAGGDPVREVVLR